ncbi:MAG TPA: histidine kinase, partial [Prolixibacteraceae bacterium]|nr:histidine kinase [Prolixibacteraceae bacterium]
MKKSTEIAVHAFFWVVFTAFVFMLCKVYLEVAPDAIFSHYLFRVVTQEVIMGMIFFYVTFFGIPWSQKKVANLAVLVSLLLFLLLLFAYPAITRFGIWQVMSSLIPHVVVIFLALIFRKFSDAIRLEKEKQELMLQQTKSELALLKMQVSPHFLFNTLNNIDYLIIHDPAKASGSISKLGDILRYLIYEADTELIALHRELNHLEDYIELVRLRTKGANYLNYKVSGLPGHLQVAPMLFLPLVENAYKHASSREGENVIQIELRIANKSLHFTAENNY